MLWAVENPSRFYEERRALEGLAAEVEWLRSINWTLTKDGLLQVNAKLSVEHEFFQVELVYPRLFPDTPAFVRPRNGVTARWSSHQYGSGGVLCLEWGPDTWRAEVTGADLLRSTYKLLSTERTLSDTSKEVPSRHSLTLGQSVRSSIRRLIINPAVAAFVKGLGNQSWRKLLTRRIYHEASLVFFISEIAQDESQAFKNTELPAGLWEYVFAWESPGWVFKSNSFPARGTFNNCKELLAAIHEAGFSDFSFPARDENSIIDFLVMIVGPEGEFRAFIAKVHGDETIKECSIVDIVEGASSRLPGEYQDLRSKRVGIVGVGSLGSKIAVSLARSGLRRFLLVDDDIMLPGNVCRNELHWAAVGASKVEATKERLSLIASDMDIQYRCTRIAGQESSESASAAADALAACDLLIDATANPSVVLLLGAISKRRSLAFVWGELFAGGIGALLARSRPRKDPDPLTTRAALHHHLETLPPAPFARTTGYDVTVADESVIASDSEVSELAAVMARMTIDTLLDPEAPEFPASVYLLGFKKAWIFEAPFDTRPLIFDVPLSSGQATTDPAEKAKAMSALLELAKQQTDGEPSLSS